jgi:regulatory protein
MARLRRRFPRVDDPAIANGPREVTTVESNPRAPGYLIIEIDGARFASLPEEKVGGLALVAGEVLDEERFQHLCRVAAAEAAYQVAMRVLAARPKAVREMLRSLRDRGHDPDAAKDAVGRLVEVGLLNDLEFSRHFALVRCAKGHGAARLVTDLLARGVDKQVAERAVNETLEAEAVDPIAQARALAEKRCAQLGDLPPRQKRRRVMAYLRRRGYLGYEIDQLVKEAMLDPR